MAVEGSAKPESVLIIGSGPIVIGQAAEFDYAGTQACKAMREEGVRSILINSNPATIMTDEGVADTVYIEPLTVEVITRIIQRERPEGLLPTLGGQVGLNLAVALHDAGVLERFNVRLLGTPLEAIKNAEDRERFRQLMHEIGEPIPPSHIVTSWAEAEDALAEIGLPAAIRPAYTLGGTGGGFATTSEEYRRLVTSGLDASPIRQVLVERSLLGWKEVEYEVMRDGADTCITVCNMENLDPMGVHTGDSVVVAPSQTLSDKDYQSLRGASLKIIRALGIEGGCNVQLALAPRPDIVPWGDDHDDYDRDSGAGLPYYVIEVNPRVSRSSALASKATGYPIARVAAKIALGRRLDEIQNAVTGKTCAAFEPALDYVVVKIPRWPFDKFGAGDRTLGIQMKATGEVMAIERTFGAALQKAVRSLEVGRRSLLWEDHSVDDPVLAAVHATDNRLWHLMTALRRDVDPEDLARRTGVDPWFLDALQGLVRMEQRLLAEPLSRDLLRAAKRMGFSDEQIANLAGSVTEKVRAQRLEWGIRPVYKMVDTCAAEFDAVTPYFYSTYEEENEALPLPSPRALVIGSGPIRIGQGIEFDYASVKAAQALQAAGYAAIMANSNPETVSTDFDTSDRLYFEPLDVEATLDILENESQAGTPGGGADGVPSILQFGGQTAINLAGPLTNAAQAIIGSSAETIDLAEDRKRCELFLADLGIPQPPGAAVTSVEDAVIAAANIGYPVLVRPSYVLGGRAMEIVQKPSELARYVSAAQEAAPGHTVLVDKYFGGLEVEVDAICDGERVLIPGIIEHIERAGVHSGDSMAVYPAPSLTTSEIEAIAAYTRQIGLGLNIRGLMNIQFVVMRDGAGADGGEVYVLEVNPRASRTVPFLSKVTTVPLVRVAVHVMLGRSIAEQGFPDGLWPTRDLVAIKAPVFSMAKLVGVDTYLGPEMKSTGEVMGIDVDFGGALTKALLAADLAVPMEGSVLLSIADRDKADALEMIRGLGSAGYTLYATEGTAEVVRGLGLPVSMVPKRLDEGSPNVVDLIRERTVDMVVNTPEGGRSTLQDGFHIRRAAAEQRVPCFTSIDTADRVVAAMLRQNDGYNVLPLRDYVRRRTADGPAVTAK